MGKLIEQLHNCPNCAGALQDNGRCRFCGSKVYDFVNFDLDSHARTYIRIRYNGRVILCPVVLDTFSISCSSSPVDAYGMSYSWLSRNIQTGSMDFMIMGDIIYGDAE